MLQTNAQSLSFVQEAQERVSVDCKRDQGM